MFRTYVIVMACVITFLGLMSSCADAAWQYDLVDPGKVTSMAEYGQYIWCGTEFGLYRWDTTNMTYDVFTRPGGQSLNSIKDIAVDSQGLVWVGFCESGVAAFDGANWINEYLPSAGNSKFVLSEVAVDNNDTFWFTAAVHTPIDIRNATLFSFDGEWHETRPSGEQLSSTNQYLAGLDITSDGAVCCGIQKKLFRYDGTWEILATDLNAYTVAFESDAAGSIWICGEIGITEYSDSVRTAIAIPAGFSIPPYLIDLKCDVDNDTWVATETGGLLRIHDGEASVVQPHADGEQWLTVLFVDNAGTVWAGRTDGGISRLSDGEWVDYYLMDGTSYGSIHAFTKDRTGTCWAASNSGILKWEDTWVLAYPDSEIPLTTNEPYKLLFTTDNTMWLSGSEILIRHTESGFVQDHTFNNIEGVLPGNSNDLYVCSSDGLWHYDPVSGEKSFMLESSYHSPAVPVLIEPNGALWSANLYRYDGSWKSYIAPGNYDVSNINGAGIDSSGFPWMSVYLTNVSNCPIISSILLKYVDDQLTVPLDFPRDVIALKTIDSNNSVWFTVRIWDSYNCTTNPDGIMTLSDSVITYYTEADGLLSNTVNDITEHNGRIWVATDIGICSMDSPTSVEENKPQIFDTVWNFPNPFNPSTTIRYSVEAETRTTVEVFNMTGQKVATLIDRIQPPGNYNVLFDGAELPSGLYFVRVINNGQVMTGKMALVK